MATIKGDWVPSGEQHLAVYETDASPAEALRAVGERAASGQLTLPGWFPEVKFATFACYLHGDHAGPRLADHLYLVFSTSPEGLDNDEFVAWYQEHADENTQVPGFVANWRYSSLVSRSRCFKSCASAIVRPPPFRSGCGMQPAPKRAL